MKLACGRAGATATTVIWPWSVPWESHGRPGQLSSRPTTRRDSNHVGSWLRSAAGLVIVIIGELFDQPPVRGLASSTEMTDSLHHFESPDAIA